MDRYCTTRMLKNARFLQIQVGYLPAREPLDGFTSLVPAAVLRRMEQMHPSEIKIKKLADMLTMNQLPRPKVKLDATLFSGSLRFVQTAFATGNSSLTVPDPDFKVAMQYAALAVVPISEYCAQYGPNSLAVDSATIQFEATLTGAKYNDSILSGWVDQIAKANGLGADSCLVFLNPQGVVNTDADATQGVLGYHNMSSSKVPYAFVNVMGQGLTVQDQQDVYAVALSHETAEMTVDPHANGGNPEVCDECAGNCSVDYRNYFDSRGVWLGGAASPGYYFFIDGIATPATVAQCPAPQTGCVYPPPKPAAAPR